VDWSLGLAGIVFLQRSLQRPSPARRFSLFFQPTELVVPETLKDLLVVSRRLLARHSHGSPLVHPVHRLSPQPVDTLASDIVFDPPCSFASHARPLGLRNLQV